MRATRLAFVLFALSTLSVLVFSSASAADSTSWPQWRGENQNGVAEGSDYPIQWSESEGIKWKLDLAGLGGSTPVIAGGKAFLTSGVDGKNRLSAIDLETGEILWGVNLGKDIGNKHRKGGGSNPSAVTDGDSVIAYFRSGDLASVSLEGDINWQVNLQEKFGEDTLWWDLGSSPTIINDLVVVAVMQTGPSYLVALNRKSGEQVWKVDRMLGAPEEAAQSYATPVALPEQNQIAVMGADNLTIHSAVDGKQLGRVQGFNPTQHQYFRSISSPAAHGNLIVCPYSRGDTVTTCRIDDVVAGKDRDSIAWHREDFGSDVPTPAISNGVVYFTRDGKKAKGTIVAVELETGKTIWTVQLPKSRHGYSSSPLVAGNHLYTTSENGTTFVIGPLDSKQPEVVSTNELADDQPFTVASPVPVDGGFLIRTRHALYRVGN